MERLFIGKLIVHASYLDLIYIAKVAKRIRNVHAPVKVRETRLKIPVRSWFKPILTPVKRPFLAAQPFESKQALMAFRPMLG